MRTDLSPTAANILSSLGVKGAAQSIPSGARGSDFAKFIPMLDENGKLNASFIPADAAQLSIPPLSDVAFVDPYTETAEFAADGITRLRVGSIVAPFKSISEAAANFSPAQDASGAKFISIVLASGRYEDTVAQFQSTPSAVAVIGIGDCVLAASPLVLAGLSSGASVIFQGVRTSQDVTIQGVSSVTCLGRTSIGRLNVGSGTRLVLSADSRVSSTDASDIRYLSEASNVGNTSNVPGKTVDAALRRLNGRKIRIAYITEGSTGLDIGSSCVDVTAESSGGFDVYDLSTREKAIAAAINKFIKKSKDITAETVTADKVVTDTLEAKTLEIDSILLGGYRLGLDMFGYLVVVDGSKPHPEPPDGIVLIRDTGTSGAGAVYVLGASDGRLYIDRYESETGTPVDALEIEDAGETYTVTVEDGRINIQGGES